LSTKNLKCFCPTRWGSVGKMIKRLGDAQQAIVVYLTRHRKEGNPTVSEEQWEIMSDLRVMLRHFNEAANELSQQKVPTAGAAICIITRLLNVSLGDEGSSTSDSDDEAAADVVADVDDGNDDDDDDDGDATADVGQLHPAVTEFRKQVVKDLHERWYMLRGGAATELLMATYLDPRTKDFDFTDEDERAYCLDEAVTLAKRFTSSIEIDSAETGPSQGGGVGDRASKMKKQKAEQERRMRLYGELAATPSRAPNHLDEVACYTRTQRCPFFAPTSDSSGSVMCDPLAWWKEHEHEFPRLAKLARRYLCISATSVPCERAFSRGGWIVNKRRCSLSDQHVAALLFLSFNKPLLDQ